MTIKIVKDALYGRIDWSFMIEALKSVYKVTKIQNFYSLSHIGTLRLCVDLCHVRYYFEFWSKRVRNKKTFTPVVDIEAEKSIFVHNRSAYGSVERKEILDKMTSLMIPLSLKNRYYDCTIFSRSTDTQCEYFVRCMDRSPLNAKVYTQTKTPLGIEPQLVQTAITMEQRLTSFIDYLALEAKNNLIEEDYSL